MKVILKELRLINFRNYEKEKVSFSPEVNIIEGPNGHGKTNLLEAIFFLSFGRSFRTNTLAEILMHGKGSFAIEALFERDNMSQRLLIQYEKGTRKLQYNDTNYPNFSQLLGLIPSVIYSPSDIELIIGAPQIRRRFLNLHLAQIDPLYVFHLTRYSKALKQRNLLLKRKKPDTIVIWEEEMAKSAEYLVTMRQKLLEDLSSYLLPYYEQLVPIQEELKVEYAPSLLGDTDTFQKHWEKSRKREMEIGNTMAGPHRDDWTVIRDGQNAKNYASEGQKRSIIAAIKLAEFQRLKERSHITPIFCIDDFGIHLDEHRISLFKEQLVHMGQVFLSTPIEHDVSGLRLQVSHGALLSCPPVG